MAKFYVGQRVRIVSSTNPASTYIGRQGTIWKIEGGGWAERVIAAGIPRDATAHAVDVDGMGRYNAVGEEIAFMASQLAPLTDPKSDEFIERIKKIAREPINVTVKERA